ncbi:MAG: hypothetical protein M3N98_05840 [Actinomycetota bacterium]|nr:hypothetical protein [Actinomycetota bacterium]
MRLPRLKHGSKVDVVLNGIQHQPGGRVGARLSLLEPLPFQWDRIEAVLAYQSHYTYEKSVDRNAVVRALNVVSIFDLNAGSPRPRTESVWVETAAATVWESGPTSTNGAHTVELDLPLDAPATCKDLVSWSLVVRAVGPEPSREIATAPFRVVSHRPPPGWLPAGPTGDTYGPLTAELEFDQDCVAAGDVLRGRARITTQGETKPISVKVRVSECLQFHPTDRLPGEPSSTLVVKADLAEHHELEPGVAHEWCFELAIPVEACPTVRSRHADLSYLVRLEANSTLMKYTNTIREIAVTSPP